MADTSLSQDSSEPEAELAVVKKKLRKKQMHSGLKEESPFPQPQPCVNGVLVQGLVSHIEEDNGCFWLQRDPDKVDGVGDMLMKGQEESYASQDTPIKGGEIKMGSAAKEVETYLGRPSPRLDEALNSDPRPPPR